MPPGGQGGSRNFNWTFNVNQKDLDRLKGTMQELAKQSQTMTDAQTKFNDVLQKGFQPPRGGASGQGGGGADWGRMAAGVLRGNASSLLMGGPAGMVIAAAVEGLSRLYDTIKGLAHEAVRLAGVFSPAHLKQLEMATGMVQATIGRRLVPVLELFTEATRGVAEALANILPDAEDVRAALSPLREVLSELKATVMDLAPFIRLNLVTAIQFAAFSLRVLTNVFAPFIDVLRLVGRSMGVGGPKLSPDLPGMASKYTGVEDIGRELAKQFSDMSYAMGKKNPQEETVDRLKAIDDFLEQVLRPAVEAVMAGKQNVEAGGEFVWATIKGMTMGAFG